MCAFQYSFSAEGARERALSELSFLVGPERAPAIVLLEGNLCQDPVRCIGLYGIPWDGLLENGLRESL